MADSRRDKRQRLTPPWGRVALAFRGYNQTNLGRSSELLAIPAYEPILREWLERAGAICARFTDSKVDLLDRVKQHREAELADYPEAVALIMGVEFAQLEMLATFHGFNVKDATLAFGYSLGELVAVATAGLLKPDDAMHVPLSLAADCAQFADNCTMAIVFSRREPISEDKLQLLCLELTAAGNGTIGISAVLSPNTYLVVGQGDTIDRMENVAKDKLGQRVSVRRNPDRWPPLHTPIVRQLNVPDRAAVIMARMATTSDSPLPPIFSLTTGQPNYTAITVREVLRDWADHPQRLWSAIEFVLDNDIQTVLHVGPEPNLIPATFTRLADNVAQQLSGASLRSYGTWAMANLVRRRWLASLLPRETALLRAPLVKQVILEDWLIENAPNKDDSTNSIATQNQSDGERPLASTPVPTE